MRLRGSLKYNRREERWIVWLWLVDEYGRTLYGQQPFETWADALSFMLWRVGASPRRG
jgi:hypothetical protein